MFLELHIPDGHHKPLNPLEDPPMRSLLLSALLAGLLLVAPAFADTVTIVGVKDGKTVLTLTTVLHGDYPLPQLEGVSYLVRFSGGDTPPDPGPGPGPDPLPEGKYRVQRQVRDWAKAVTDPKRIETVDTLSRTYAGLPSLLTGVNATLPQAQVIHKTTIETVMKLVTGSVAWGTFNANVESRLKALVDTGAIKTVQEFNECLAEIATGLNAAK